MNKNILKYVLRGLIAFGTVNLLNGVSLKIVEQEQQKQVGTRASKAANHPVKTVQKTVITPICPKNTPQKSVPEPVEQTTAKQTEKSEQETAQAPRNQFVIDSLKTAMSTPKEDLAKKHKNSYQLPGYYTQKQAVSEQNRSQSKDLVAPKESREENYFQNNNNCSGSYDSSSSNNRRSGSSESEDAMLNQLIQSMMAQENGGSRTSGPSYTGSQNSAGASASPRYSSNTTIPSNQQDTKKDVKNTPKDTVKQNAETETTVNTTNGFTEPEDNTSETTQKELKKLKKKNKKREQAEAAALVKAQEQAKNKLLETKSPEAKKAPIAQPVTPATTEQKPADQAAPIEIPAELIECNTKFDEMVTKFLTTGTPCDEKIMTELYDKSKTWIETAKIQKDLTSYKTFIAQKSAACDSAIADIAAQKELTEEVKNACKMGLTQIKSVYEEISKLFSTQEQPKSTGIVDRVCNKIGDACNSVADTINNNRILAGAAAALTAGAAFAAKYFANKKQTPE